MIHFSNSSLVSTNKMMKYLNLRVIHVVNFSGVSKHFHMGCLVDYMNNVYEDEDTDFEDVLTSEDLHELTTKRNTTGKPRVFKPRYKIRPTAELVSLPSCFFFFLFCFIT